MNIGLSSKYPPFIRLILFMPKKEWIDFGRLVGLFRLISHQLVANNNLMTPIWKPLMKL